MSRSSGGRGRPRVSLGVVLLGVLAMSLLCMVHNELQLLRASGDGRVDPANGNVINGNALVAAVLSPAAAPREETTSDRSSAETTPSSAPETTPTPTAIPTASPSVMSAFGDARVPAPPDETTNVTVSETIAPAPIPQTSPTTPSTTTMHPLTYDRVADGDLDTHFECVGFHRTGKSTPDGPREPQHDKRCDAPINGCVSGYCVFRHTQSGELRRALLLHSNSLPCKLRIQCSKAGEMLRYGENSVKYAHDPAFDLGTNRAEAMAAAMAGTENASYLESALSFERGITMVVHTKVLGSAYISIRSLRAHGSTLPVEIWYKRSEVEPDHPILLELVATHGVFLREISDPRATKYYTKLYAVFYSAFDHVLLLDADNFAVTDPTYLFDTPEYQATGAMFWPDFWQPAATIFHVVRDDLLWQVLGIPFVDMFEQESGQVLIDRRRHQKALNVLMFYGFSMPRVHEDLQFVWGDKDLFRLAWLKTNSSFHYITRPPGAAGRLDPRTNRFCGVTMVQHDPLNEIVFLHRNMVKMVAGAHNKRVWTHIQQFQLGAPLDKYRLKSARNVFPDLANCWGLGDAARDSFTLTPLAAFPFQHLETALLQFGNDAGALLQQSSRQPRSLRGLQ